RAVEVGVAADGAELPEGDLLAVLVLLRELVAERREAEVVDVGAVVVVLAGAAPRVGGEEALALGDGRGAGRRVVVHLVAAAPLAEVAAHVLAPAALGLAGVRRGVAQLEG